MLNSKDNYLAKKTVTSMAVEIIAPADGRGETGYFLAICAAIILLAAGLLWALHKPTYNTLSELPKSLSNLATQISNALEEITLLEETGIISAPYDLQDLPLPQSGQNTFLQQNDHCFILKTHNILFAVEQEQHQWSAQWVQSSHLLDCHANLIWHPLNR